MHSPDDSDSNWGVGQLWSLEISFFNQVNTGTLGGKGGPFDQVAYKQKLSQVSRLIFLSLYHLQVFFYRIKRIGHWFKASQLRVQPMEGGLRLCRPIEGGPAAQTWRCLETGPRCRFSREASDGSPVHVLRQTQPPTLAAGIGGIERDVRRRPSQPTADPPRFSQSSVLPRGGDWIETGVDGTVKSKSSPNSCCSVRTRIARDWHGCVGGCGGCQVICKHFCGEFPGMAGPAFLPGGWRATIHQRGAQACVIWISWWSKGLGALTDPIMYPTPTRVASQPVSISTSNINFI